MVAITCDGRIASEISRTTTRAGLAKSEFVLECSSPNSLPMQFAVCSFGKMAEETTAFRIHEHVLVYGRLACNSAGQSQRLVLLASLFEILAG